MLFGLGDLRMRRMFIDEAETSEEHKRREHQRLAALVGYCEATHCRRQTLLRYFGESDEEFEPCGNCDACLEPAVMVDGSEAARQILSLVLQTGERFGAAHIVDVLRGAETEKILQCEHNRLAAHGAGSTRKKDEWRALIRQMVAGGVLIHDAGGFGGLSLSAEGKALLKGGKQFLVRQHVRSSRKERAAATTLSHEEGDLLAVLKRLRLSIAARRHVPAYLIFSDKTLQEMARQVPRDLDSFATISGVGTSKLRDFGRLFIDAIAAHIEGADALR